MVFNKDPNYDDENEEEEEEDPQRLKRRQVGGAAVVGGVVGMVVAGPILGVVAAAGVAYMAHTNKSKAGDAVRSTGGTVVNAGDKVKTWSAKNRVGEKCRNGVFGSIDFVQSKFKGKDGK